MIKHDNSIRLTNCEKRVLKSLTGDDTPNITTEMELEVYVNSYIDILHGDEVYDPRDELDLVLKMLLAGDQLDECNERAKAIRKKRMLSLKHKTRLERLGKLK